MAYNEELAGRIRKIFPRESGVTEKKMFGGLSFLLQGKMVCGILKDDLVVRIDPNETDELLDKPHVRPMDFTGRPMKGFLYISPGALNTDRELENWIELSVDYVSTLLPKTLSKKK